MPSTARKRPRGETKKNRVLPRLAPDAEKGLTRAEAEERLRCGYGNESPKPPERAMGQIIADNLFTYFNLIFAALAACVIAAGSYKDLTFLPIVIINIVIGTVQELRSRRALRAMTLVAEPRAVVIRDGAELAIPCEQSVRDDVAVFSGGRQIYADAVVLSGECRVNEALVTGEADEIIKTPGTTLLSGSFVVSGECRARLDKVGAESFASRLTLEAKKNNKKMRSEMMYALTRLVKIIGFVIIPSGAVMLYQQFRVLKLDFSEGMVTTVAALIGMIPEGLYLLVSVALAVSVMRLARRRALVREMRCIETLARVDVLCVDKTGTITEPEMAVRGTVPLAPDEFPAEKIDGVMSDYLGGADAENETLAALARHFTAPPRLRAVKRLPFTSVNKFAGARLSDGSVYLLGAPDKLLCAGSPHAATAAKYASEGYRVLLLSSFSGDLDDAEKTPRQGTEPLALILLTNKIRDAAPGTFRFFAEQGVSIRVISGDNAATVSRIAQDAGIENAEKYIDASELKTERQIRRAASEHVVFGRVTPDVKRRLVRAFKAAGHTVAMTGDGVNDVLALKDADCGIAMASGSEVACHIAQLVLLDSDFSAMTSVVMEGRRVINNIERSASLFLVKNIFSFTMTLLALLFAMSYPMAPSQLTLFNVMFIGVPSFALALEPNRARVRGSFMANVLINALPAGLTDLLAVLAVVTLGERFSLSPGEMSTMSTIVLAFVGLLMLIKVSRPLNKMRKALIVAMPVCFALGAVILRDMFGMTPLGGRASLVTALVCLASVPVIMALSALARYIRARFPGADARRRPRRVRV
ncbi:MAG: cation-translocating P-type ATPase [Oscillospiraceae bacterium]|jgi:cation-transporting ATPase E|nr:cation-translocating P-type ATPase [Oscillospiraceae bacterium]